jgi:hypothetical protein
MSSVRNRTRKIDERLRSTLKGTEQHKGFGIALEAVNEDMGTLVLVAADEFALPVCPDCGAQMIKKAGTIGTDGTDGGGTKNVVAWVCECEPTQPQPSEPSEAPAADADDDL